MTIKSIVINGKTILSTPNAINEGVWFDMLEVHQAAGLPANKTFSQWRSRQSRALEEAGKCRLTACRRPCVEALRQCWPTLCGRTLLSGLRWFATLRLRLSESGLTASSLSTVTTPM